MDGALSNRTYLLVLFADILLSWPLLSCTSWFPVWYQEALNPLPLCAPRTFACVCMLQDLSLSPVQSRRMTLNAAGKCVEKKKTHIQIDTHAQRCPPHSFSSSLSLLNHHISLHIWMQSFSYIYIPLAALDKSVGQFEGFVKLSV